MGWEKAITVVIASLNILLLVSGNESQLLYPEILLSGADESLLGLGKLFQRNSTEYIFVLRASKQK